MAYSSDMQVCNRCNVIMMIYR